MTRKLLLFILPICMVLALLPQIAHAQAATTTTVTVSPNPVTPPASVTLVASVAGSNGIPTGTVTFTCTSGSICPGTLGAVALADGSGTLTFATSGISGGTLILEASYSGDSSNAASTSPTVTLTIKGAGALTATYTAYNDFTTTQATSNPGANPASPLVEGPDGNFYGTLAFGGPAASESAKNYGYGAIYRAAFPGSATILYQFTGGADGYEPFAGLVLGTDGNFYGTTIGGGDQDNSSVCATYGCGTIFKITSAGTLTTLFALPNNGTDGISPYGALLQAADGNFYGTAVEGGNTALCVNSTTGIMGCGTLFRFNATTQVLTVLHTFGGTTDQSAPMANLIQASDGNLYGTTYGTTFGSLDQGVEACTKGCGTIFEYNLGTQTFSTLYSFSGPDGATPEAALWEGSTGMLYGVTAGGGGTCNADPAGCGTVFVYSLSEGTLTTLHSFTGAPPDVFAPEFGLFQAGDGNLYGYGNTSLEGDAMFSVSTSTAFNNISGNTAGGDESSGLVQGGDGKFYGSQFGGYATNYVDCESKNVCGNLFSATLSSNPAPAVQVTLSPSTGAIGQPETLTWNVNNAISKQLQQCYAFTSTGGGSGWSGQINFTPVNGAASGTATVTPTGGGILTYALNCGGVETGVATLTIGTTTTTLSASPSSVAGGTPITLTATVTNGAVTPTGSVNFYQGTTLLGASTLDGTGTATFSMSTANLYKGTYTVTATYTGSSTLAPSTSTAQTITITSSKAESQTLSGASGLTISQGSSLTLSATVTQVGSSAIPTGTVTFASGATTIGTVLLNASGAGSLTVPSVNVPIGPYPIIGTYSGDANNFGSASSALQVTIVYGTEPDFTAIADGLSSLTLSTTVTSKGDVTPTGTVTYSVGTLTIGTATLTSGVGKFTASTAGYAAGNYSVTAKYSGDSKNNASSTTITVPLLAPTSTTISASPNPVTPPGQIVLTATVKRTSASGTPSSGNVTFYYGTLSLGSAMVNNGAASITASTSGLAAGTYKITANYAGDALDAKSNATGISVTVK